MCMPNPIPDGQRNAIKERDRNRCQNCFRTQSEGATLEVHRIVPASGGGRTQLTNLVLLCQHCHRAAHDDHQRRNDTCCPE